MSQWMSIAFQCAKKAIGISRPNPAVGAVIVKNGKVCSMGQTQRPGNAHAEVMALQMAKENAKEADLYVTLEPCCHFGRTPPCTNAIISAGIKRVFFAHADPNPKVLGKSRKILEEAGIEVFEGVKACSENKELYSEIEEFYKAYDYFVKYQIPYIELKIAKTQDGFIAQKDYSPLKITHEKANQWNHSLRGISDAILIGASTACKDNPKLDVRLVEGNFPVKIIMGKNPSLPKSLQLFSGAPTLIFSENPNKELENLAELIQLPSSNFKENWKFVIKYLGNLGMHRLMVEPGQKLFQLILETGVWNKIYLFESPIEVREGISIPAIKLAPKETRKIGEDTLYIYENSFERAF